MEKIRINFYKCIQDSQEFGSTNEHMMSRLFFKINSNEYVCDIRQPYGSNHSFEQDPIEVSTPENLQKIVDYEQFRQAAEQYYRNIIGQNGSIINIGNSSGIRMWHNTIHKDSIAEIDPVGFSTGW